MNRRVAITGIGVVSAVGLNRQQFWQSLAEGKCGIGPIESISTEGLRFQHAAEVRGFDPLVALDPKEVDQLDRNAHFAIAAAREAVDDARLELTRELGERCAIATGCAVGGKASEDASYYELYAEKKTRFHPLTIPRVMANGAASAISSKFGITGPVWNVSTACSSANHALGQAFAMVRGGQVEVALAGGCEGLMAYGFLKAWDVMRVVAPDTCRPFSKDRKGMVLGEGAAILILEPLERAQARGARIYCEIAGFGLGSDAFHLTMPSPDGGARAMSMALRDAGLAPEQIGYINAHGTGTPANDSTETKAIRAVFGDHAERLPVSSTKSMHGHALGAAGALEAAATVLALHHGLLPPTANYTTPDPECDLDVVPNVSRAVRVEAALSNSFAFGGLNAVLAFKAPASL